MVWVRCEPFSWFLPVWDQMLRWEFLEVLSRADKGNMLRAEYSSQRGLSFMCLK